MKFLSIISIILILSCNNSNNLKNGTNNCLCAECLGHINHSVAVTDTTFHIPNSMLDFSKDITIDERTFLLEQEVDTLLLVYTSMAGAVPNWIELKYAFKDKEHSFSKEYIYVEASNDALILPQEVLWGGNTFRFIGKYYKKPTTPTNNTSMFNSDPYPGTVFRYYRYDILNGYGIEPTSYDSIDGKPVQVYVKWHDSVFPIFKKNDTN